MNDDVMTDPNIRPIRSFARSGSPNKLLSQSELAELLHGVYSISDGVINKIACGNHTQLHKIAFEIGFGHGEHVHALAVHNPKMLIVGCEPYVEGMTSAIKQLQASAVDNVMLHMGDALTLLKNEIPDSSLDELYILFPDPWPKTKHHKRRIINAANLKLLHLKLKPSGKLIIATDHEEYARWIDCALKEASDMYSSIYAPSWHSNIPPQDWILTRYNNKAIKNLKKVYYYILNISKE